MSGVDTVEIIFIVIVFVGSMGGFIWAATKDD